MILRSGNAASFLIEFPSGRPDGNISWTVLGPDGTSEDVGNVVVAADAVSANIVVPSEANTLEVGEMSSYRDLVWSYTVDSELVNAERRYTIEARIPFGVSPDGVRTKLGVEPHDLPDSEISLLKAYYRFANLVSGSEFPAVTLASADEHHIKEAIEALAALALIPTMQVRVALKESSGTDTFQRDKVDWTAIAAHLEEVVTSGMLIIVPTIDLLSGFGSIFLLAAPATDPFTAEGAAG